MTQPEGQPDGRAGRSVHLSAGTMSGFVVGDHATVHISQGAAGDDAMARLERALRDLTAVAKRELSPSQAQQVHDDIERVDREVHHPRPDREMLTQPLQRITAAAAATSAVAQAVSTVRDLIAAVLP